MKDPFYYRPLVHLNFRSHSAKRLPIHASANSRVPFAYTATVARCVAFRFFPVREGAMTLDDDAVPSISAPSYHTTAPSPSHSPLASPSSDSSTVASEDEKPRLAARPKLGSRKSSGSMIVPRDQAQTDVHDDIEEGDVRAMSPRRSSQEVDKLGEAARKDLIEQAKVLQTSLQAIVDRVEEVKSEHEKLEGGNKFLQSFVNPRLPYPGSIC